MTGPFAEIAALLLAAAVAGAVAVRLRQPVIIAFIGIGIVAGPAGLGVVSAQEQIDLLAQLGITVLLFLVGLKLDLALVRNFGAAAVATGLGQLTFTIGFGFLIALGLGFDARTALYIAVALTFSSTIIIVKLLTDKRELDSLHGRIAVGFLIVQDIAVVVAMAVLGGIGAAAPDRGVALLALPAVTIGGGIAIALLMRFVLPAVLHALASSPELLVVFAFAWAMSLAAGGQALGLSKELGAFVAGFTLASTGYREAIGARLAGVRDFLLFFFFLDLGTRLEFVAPGQTAVRAAVLSTFILVGNPLIVMVIMGLLGYRSRTGFLAGLTVAQISEFSLIFLALGIEIGHVSQDVMGLVTVIGIVTIVGSTYMILYGSTLHRMLARWLGVFERRDPVRERRLVEASGGARPADTVVYGLGRYGRALTERLTESGYQVLGVDFDPETVRAADQQGLAVVFGDAADPDFPRYLSLEGVRLVVSTLPDREVNLVLLQALRDAGYRGRAAVTAHTARDAEALRQVAGSMVLLPFADAAVAAARLVREHSWLEGGERSDEPGRSGDAGVDRPADGEKKETDAAT